MEYKNIYLVSCSGLNKQKIGENHHLNFESNVGAVLAKDEEIEDVSRLLSAESGVITVESCQNISRELLFDLLLHPPDNLTLAEINGYNHEDEQSVSKENLSDVPCSMTIIRTAVLEYNHDGNREKIKYKQGRFSASSEQGIHVIAESVAPRIVS